MIDDWIEKYYKIHEYNQNKMVMYRNNLNAFQTLNDDQTKIDFEIVYQYSFVPRDEILNCTIISNNC